MRFMNRAHAAPLRQIAIAAALLLLLNAPCRLPGQPTPGANAAFDSYSKRVESRLAGQHSSPAAFLAFATSNPEEVRMSLLEGRPMIERLSPSGDANFPKALLHHWRGSAFAPGAKASDFERLMRNFDAYPQHFSPQVTDAKVVAQRGDRAQVEMRLRQRHVITVVLDTAYDIGFGQLDARHGYSISRSTRIAEIEAAGTPAERALSASEDHGFLWRLNTYWSYEERDGGLYLQIESVSLTRSIPPGLDWAVRPYVESIPRDALEFTLRAVSNALR
jgi:hypothetical protein